jgi:transposase-like protein
MTLRSTAEREKLVEEYWHSGKTKKQWCEENDIPYTTFANWTKHLPQETIRHQKSAQAVKWASVTPQATLPAAPVTQATSPVSGTPEIPAGTLITPSIPLSTTQHNAAASSASPPVIIRIRGDYEIDVEPGFDPELLAGVLRVVKRICC